MNVAFYLDFFRVRVPNDGTFLSNQGGNVMPSGSELDSDLGAEVPVAPTTKNRFVFSRF